MNEQIRIDNVLKLLRRGTWNINGEEILAFAQAYQYLIEKKEELSKPKAVAVEALPEIVKKGKK